MQAAQEQLRALGRADHDPEPEAGGIVEEEHGHTLSAPGTGAEVLAVGEHHHQAVRVREAALVGFLLGGHAAQRQAQADTGAPDRRPIDALLRADHAALMGAAEELGDRGVAVLGFLLGEEGEQRLGPRPRDRGRGPRRLDAGRPVAVELREPAIDGADGTGLLLAGERQVGLRGDRAHGGIGPLARELSGLHRRDDLVAEQRLG
jgi:hypothetical protein